MRNRKVKDAGNHKDYQDPSSGDGDFEEIFDDEQQGVMAGTGQDIVLWPWDLK